MILLDLDNAPLSSVQYVGGAYYDKEENEFVFTLNVMHDSNADHTVLDVEWAEEVPNDREEVEGDIEREFNFITQ